MKKRTLALILALVLVATAAVAGTVAWLSDTTQEVENTFTVGNIDITLTETDSDDVDTDANKNAYKMIPGSDIAKDPKVTVLKGSEACYVFVKIEKTNPVGKKDGANVNYTVDQFLDYTIDSNWKKLDGVDGVYYREQSTLVDATDDATYSVLTGDKVTVRNAVTKEMMDAISAEGATLPKLTFTAYAVQKANVADAATAWTIAQNNGNP